MRRTKDVRKRERSEERCGRMEGKYVEPSQEATALKLKLQELQEKERLVRVILRESLRL